MRVTRQGIKRVLTLIIAGELTFCIGLIGYLHLTKPTGKLASFTRYGLVIAPPQRAAVFHKKVNAGIPVRLKIPKIQVDAAIEQVGLTPEKDLDAPKNPANAAWYSQGPRPGDSGNAIINGHFGYKNRLAAVFDNLHKLEKGDTLQVEDEQGVTTTFVVRELRTYRPNQDAKAVFYPSDGKDHLNLITCQGVWNQTQKSYSGRLVVFSDEQPAP